MFGKKISIESRMSNCTHILEIDKILLQIQKKSNYIVNMCFKKLPFLDFNKMKSVEMRCLRKPPQLPAPPESSPLLLSCSNTAQHGTLFCTSTIYSLIWILACPSKKRYKCEVKELFYHPTDAKKCRTPHFA